MSFSADALAVMPADQRASNREPRLVVLISGNGSNLQALIDAIGEGRLRSRITRVISNRRGAFGLTRAEQAGISTSYLPLKPYLAREGGRAAYDEALADVIASERPDLIVLAGWMHIFTPAFVARFSGRMINLHPALPGCFPGAHAIADAFAAFERGEIGESGESGCMVHEVTDDLDVGRVIAQVRVPFVPDDTLEAFEARIHAAEHDLIITGVAAKLAELGFPTAAESLPTPRAAGHVEGGKHGG